MNKDLIKREDAIEAIEWVDWYHQNSNKDMVHGANSNDHQPWYKAQDIYEALEAVPSADRPQGEWIEHKWIKYNEELMLEIPMHNYECSKCHSILHEASGTYFCPNCGAQMKGADNETD